MRANKTLILVGTALVAILFCVALANMQYVTPPRLVIQFDGKPAGNVTLVLPDGSDGPCQLDEEGSITAREIGWRETSLLVPFPDGSGGASVGFPKHGTKVVDFQGRVTTTTLVRYFGLVSEEYEQFNLTDEEMADIESGRRSSAEIVESIRQSESEGAIAPTGLTIVVCDSTNHVLDTLVVPRDIENGHFDFIVPEDIDEIRVFAMGNRIVGIGGTGGILNPLLRKEISETLTKNYFVARSEARGGMDFVAAEIEEGVLSGISAGEAPRPLKVTGQMRRQIRADIAAGNRAPIIYRHEDDESGRGGFRRVLAD